MMYYVNKIVGFIVSPIGGAIVGAVCVLVLSRLGRKRVARWICGLTVAWLWLWMMPVMTRVIGEPLEREFLVGGRVPTVESFPEADAIVLLGGGMGVETNLSNYAEMWAGADRVWQAARLWKVGKAPKIIATGDGARESTLGLLKDFGVDEKCVEFLDARNTEEEAKGVGESLERRVESLELGVSDENKHHCSTSTLNFDSKITASNLKTAKPKVLLVTSAWHMKRARMMFEKYAPSVEVVCAPADFECTMGAKRGCLLLPDANVFYLNSAAFHEWVGIVGYKFFR